MKWRIYFSHLIEYIDFCKNCSFVVSLLLLDNLWALFFYAFFLNFRTDSLICVLIRVIYGATQRGKTAEMLERRARMDKLKTAAYCRVSTDMETQEGSYELQVAYFTDLINANPTMELVGIYGDKGKSGLKISGRPGLQKLIRRWKKWLVTEVVSHIFFTGKSFASVELP